MDVPSRLLSVLSRDHSPQSGFSWWDFHTHEIASARVRKQLSRFALYYFLAIRF